MRDGTEKRADGVGTERSPQTEQAAPRGTARRVGFCARLLRRMWGQQCLK